MFDSLRSYLKKPALYEPGTGKLWDDEHISKGMLAAHLNPTGEAATRKHEFVDQSAAWIAQIAPPAQYTRLLDLGCGPGLYAERFAKMGYRVTGLDFSKRSIVYAKEQAKLNKSDIVYHYQDYLSMNYEAQFDVVTLIYCDYAALCVTDRLALLKKVYQALRPGGLFIFDVFTPCMRSAERQPWHYFEQGGFFSQAPHLCLEAVYQYDDADHTELRQSVVIAKEGICSYHVWDHFFEKETLLAEILPQGFGQVDFYGDVAGKPFSPENQTICAVLCK